MKKYAFALAFILSASAAFAVEMPSITSNTTRDGSANPVNNSTSMGDETDAHINGNSPVIIDNRGRTSPTEDVTASPDAAPITVRSHHHKASDETAPENTPGDNDPMGAGR